MNYIAFFFLLLSEAAFADTSQFYQLLASDFKGSSLRATRLDRQWAPALPALCEPFSRLQDHLLSGHPEESITLLPSEDPVAADRAPGLWAFAFDNGPESISYRWGKNDLWYETVAINKASCHLEVTAEH